MRGTLLTIGTLLSACSTPKHTNVPKQKEFASSFELLEYASQWTTAKQTPENLDVLLEKSSAACDTAPSLEQAYGCHALAEFLTIGGRDINALLPHANEAMVHKTKVNADNITLNFITMKDLYQKEACAKREPLQKIMDLAIDRRLMLESVEIYARRAQDLYLKFKPVNGIQLLTRTYETLTQAEFASGTLRTLQASIDTMRYRCKSFDRGY